MFSFGAVCLQLHGQDVSKSKSNCKLLWPQKLLLVIAKKTVSSEIKALILRQLFHGTMTRLDIIKVGQFFSVKLRSYVTFHFLVKCCKLYLW